MLEADPGQFPPLDGSQLRIGIVQARFNYNITQHLSTVCLQELERLGVQEGNVLHVQVAGALELPLALQLMAHSSNRFDALIALGCVIRGKTYHFELVANESGAGITRVMLDTVVPIANAVLTVEDYSQAIARQSDKGRDAARVAVEMALLKKQLA